MCRTTFVSSSDKSKRLQVMVRDVFEVSKATTGNLSVDIK